MWPLFVQTAMTATLTTGTTSSPGIRLGPQEVAGAVWAAVHPSRPRAAIHQVHFPVGLQTRALSLGSRFSPGWLTRVVNQRLGGGH